MNPNELGDLASHINISTSQFYFPERLQPTNILKLQDYLKMGKGIDSASIKSQCLLYIK